MMPARRATCGLLALLMAAGSLRALDAARQPVPRRTAAAAEARAITVSVVPADGPMTELEAAQPPAVNSARPTDQNSSSAGAEPSAMIVSGAGSREADNETYLPASQLTGWPQARGLAATYVEDGEDGEADTAPFAASRSPTTVEAVLMIDEQGGVNRVQFNDEALELPVRQWLDRRLRALRFVPGHLFGRPVRSRLTIELALH
jgi:hypothetical protein